MGKHAAARSRFANDRCHVIVAGRTIFSTLFHTGIRRPGHCHCFAVVNSAVPSIYLDDVQSNGNKERKEPDIHDSHCLDAARLHKDSDGNAVRLL
jgi:hypothetical protein